MYTYGAERLKPGPVSEGIRAGGSPPRPDPVPDGLVHAIDEDGHAACGREIPGGFVALPGLETLEWDHSSFLDHCPECTAVLRERGF